MNYGDVREKLSKFHYSQSNSIYVHDIIQIWILRSPNKGNIWLKNIEGNWRDSTCPCGSNFHFNGDIDELFSWERIHLRHMSSDPQNHAMLSLYPKDMVIFYHSTSGYIVEIRKHKRHEIKDLQNACLHGNVKLAGV